MARTRQLKMQASPHMRILVVDDHQIVRHGVRALLEAERSFEVCGEAADGLEAVDRVAALKPDAVVMDINMPNLDGIEATRRIAASFPNILIIILSQHDFPHIMHQAMNAGASAYVVKAAAATDLVPALVKLHRGDPFRTPAVFGSMQRHVNVEEILRRSMALEAALRDSEEQFRLTFELAAVGIAHVAEDGHWIRVNQKLCDILGYTQTELLTLRFQDVSHPGELLADVEMADQLLKKEINQYSVEKRCVRKDGAIVWCEVNTAAVYDSERRFKYFVRVLQDITVRKRAEHALAKEVSDLKLMQEISTKLIEEENASQLYELIVDAAVSIMQSDFASMQLLDSRRGEPGELLLLSFRGFTREAARFWRRVSADSGSTCAAALRTRKRVIASDVETCEFMVGTDDLVTYRNTGIRAVQTTPLLSRAGRLVGMISTHWRTVHAPTERDLRMFDVLARQAADLIERRRSDDNYRDAVSAGD